MKIYESGFGGTSGVGNTPGSEPVNSRSSSSTSASTSSPQDHVDLSSTLGNLSRALSSFHTSRAARVQSLASQFQSGQYKVDAAAVSHSIVGDAIASGPSGEGGSGGGGGAASASGGGK